MGQFISVIMKPTLGCNLQCRHCYHRPSEVDSSVMGRDVLDKTISLVAREYDSAWFIWHGGEPLTAGESFFKTAYALEKKHYGKRIARCGNTIQTNGTLLRPRFAEFCKGSRFNIGISYEAGLDRGLRPGADGDRIETMLSYMKEKKHMFSASATIHGGNVDDMAEIYERFNEASVPFTYNPVIPIGCAADNPDLVLDEEDYIKGCTEVFDRWMTDPNAKIPLMPFYQYVMTVVKDNPNISDCAHSSCLMSWICVHPNGDVYPCGKACPEDLRMGNILEMESISEAFDSEGFARILEASISRREKCQGCEIYKWCNGGCSVDAMAENGMEENGGFSCTTYKAIFLHIKSEIERILREKPDLSGYNRFVRDAIVGKIINPRTYDSVVRIQ